MNENMNRNEAELNEAALEGVSGGDIAYKYVQKASKICRFCSYDSRCSYYKLGLAEYLQEHNILDCSDDVYSCPFYRARH